ncbi:MAG: hypothetical protein AVO38_01205 [delta proteobacterium ML8_D]|nr:MAG: hypothetical protein AVO38_01205 [delta proteobacterium ML8_D]
MKISFRTIQDLLDRSKKQRAELMETYALIPSSHCRRRALCCSLLPEISLLEALAVIRYLLDLDSDVRLQLTKDLVRYFFLNSVCINSCPFLSHRNCLIYENRFFGCRAYGLWPKNYYHELAERTHLVNRHNQRLWQDFGISLPQEVVDFQVPYCPYVKPDSDTSVNNKTLTHAADKIEKLSKQLAPWHDSFRQTYFSDLSFFTASLAFGLNEAVRMKFAFVKDYVITENQTGLSEVINNLPDVFAGLA